MGRIGPLSCPSQSAGLAAPPPHRPPLRSLNPPAVSAAAGAANKRKAAVWAKPTAKTSAAFEQAHCRPSQPQLMGRIGPLSCPSQSAGLAAPPPHRPPLRSLNPRPAVSAAAGAANKRKAAVWAKPTAKTSAAFEQAHCRPSQPQLMGRIGPLSCPSQSAGLAAPPPHRPPLRSLNPPAVSAAAGAANKRKAAVWAKPTAKKQKLASSGVPEVMSSAEVDRKLWHGASAAGWTGK